MFEGDSTHREGEDLPGDLPVIEADETFRFSCGPNSPCFNRCCAQLTLPLTPYDVLRLSGNLDLPSAEFLHMFTQMRRDPETGLPMFFLRMIESVDAPCPFVTPAGCSVYEDRPGACRSYPLGRGARLDKNGIAERLFLVREEHCRGFDSGPEWTAAKWFAAEGMEKYIAFNDSYMRLLSMIRASGKPITAKFFNMALLSLWQIDNLRQFFEKMKIADQVEGPVLARAQSGEASSEEWLLLGLNWLELLIFGKSPELWRKNTG